MTESFEFHTARGYESQNIDKNSLTASMEDYLEMICRLSQTKGYVRVTELGKALNVQTPSVTKMVQKLHERNLVSYEPYGILRLTKKGKELGEFLLSRHNTLKEFLVMIGVKHNLHVDVEKIEHNVGNDTLSCIFSLVEFFRQYPETLQNYYQFRESPKNNKTV